MTFTRPLCMLTCITLISCAATTFAAPSENNDQAARKADMLKKFDKDGDGKLSDAEKTALRAEMQNRQGGKDRRQWTPEQRADMLKKFDKDGDGKLSDAEKTTLRADMQKRRGGKDRSQRTPEQRAETLKKFDKDGNGELSVDERNAAREAMKASRSEGEKRQGKKN